MSQEMGRQLQDGIQQLASSHGDMVRGMMHLSQKAGQEGAVSATTKKLIFIALAVQQKCSYCIVHHVHEALQAGLSREEILEATQVAVAMGGGPSLAYTATEVQRALDSFQG